MSKIYIKIFLLGSMLQSCEKFIKVDAPVTSTNSSIVYNDDQLSIAVLTGVYFKMINQTLLANSAGGILSMSLFPGLSSDELTLFQLTSTRLYPYYINDLTNRNSVQSDYWSQIYPIIFIVNDALRGLENSSSLSESVKKTLVGEAKFIRAFCYFYLANLYGDVPLILSPDYELNRLLPREVAKQVWDQIIIDLIEAQNNLPQKYLKGDLAPYEAGSEERIRPTYWAATALLARSYLYIKDFSRAEIEATKVINNSSLFSLTPLNEVFKKNSKEAIWQLQPVGVGAQANTPEGQLFVLPATGPRSTFPVYLSSHLLNSFEVNDKRRIAGNWVSSVKVGINTYFYPSKYKIGVLNSATSEYSMVIRLAEMFLIRAEARTMMANLDGARNDLSSIRNRAGLQTLIPNNRDSLFAAILHERQVELFCEWGHRWLDLKRTNIVDSVMKTVTLTKGGTWQNTDQYYPIILSELEKAPQLTQNDGY